MIAFVLNAQRRLPLESSHLRPKHRVVGLPQEALRPGHRPLQRRMRQGSSLRQNEPHFVSQ